MSRLNILRIRAWQGAAVAMDQIKGQAQEAKEGSFATWVRPFDQRTDHGLATVLTAAREKAQEYYEQSAESHEI